MNKLYPKFIFVGDQAKIDEYILENNIHKKELYKIYSNEKMNYSMIPEYLSNKNSVEKSYQYLFMRGCGITNTEIILIDQPDLVQEYIEHTISMSFGELSNSLPSRPIIKRIETRAPEITLKELPNNLISFDSCELPKEISSLINSFNGLDLVAMDELDPEVVLSAFYYFKTACKKLNCKTTTMVVEDICIQSLWSMWDSWFSGYSLDKEVLIAHKSHMFNLFNYLLKKKLDL